MIHKNLQKGVLVKMIEKGMILWLTNQCNAIEDIKLDLYSTNLGILKL